MNIPIKPKREFSALLPSVSVTDEMRQELVSISTQHNASIASVVRTAIEFFLSQSDKKISNQDIKTNNQ
jgi:hypothetical protein